MRILHVLNGLQAGGIEALALQMIRHGPPGATHLLFNFNSREQAMLTAFEDLRFSGQLKSLHQCKPRDGAKLFWESFSICFRQQPDALLIYPFQRPLLWVALGARLAGVRRIAVHLGNTAPEEIKGRRSWYRLLRWFQWIGVTSVPCSEAVAQSLCPLPRGLKLGPIISNGCDVNSIAATATARRDSRSPKDLHRILMVARLDLIKDHGTLMRAYAAVRQPDWQLQFVGEGPQRRTLEILAEELELDPAAILLGRRSDIPELLGQADVFAFSTTAAEGFGIALIEALAAGLPVLASDVSACREVLAGGKAGELIPPRDVKAWSRSLQQVMSSRQRRIELSQRASKYASRYDIAKTAHHWYLLLES